MQAIFHVVMPSYNRPVLLKRAVLSVLNQTYANWYLWIVDDASDSPQIHDTFKWIDLLNDSRVTLTVNSTNQGVNHARNVALDQIQTSSVPGFITFLDDDDYFIESAFSQMVEYISVKTHLKWWIANCIEANGNKVSRIKSYGYGNYLWDDMYGKNIKGDVVHFMHTSIVSDHRFLREIRNGEEWFWFSEIAKTNDLYSIDLGLKVVEYQQGGLSDKLENREKKLQVFLIKERSCEGLPPNYRVI